MLPEVVITPPIFFATNVHTLNEVEPYEPDVVPESVCIDSDLTTNLHIIPVERVKLAL